MDRMDDFTHFAGILAIVPGFNSNNGCGWAGFDEHSGLLQGCGLIKPFAPGAPIVNNMMEALHKLCQVWEDGVGFRYKPLKISFFICNDEVDVSLEGDAIALIGKMPLDVGFTDIAG